MFGQVVAATTNIRGHTRVAVKMLKPGASSSDLSDLVMEYNLLKELDHPNVIKLLGACTDSRGPLYLIMEFAEHGSLRNYLKHPRSEQAKDVDQVPIPEEILSFGWQISKGMAYLEGLKVSFRKIVLTLCDFQPSGCPSGPGHTKCPPSRGRRREGLQSVRLRNVSRCLR